MKCNFSDEVLQAKHDQVMLKRKNEVKELVKRENEVFIDCKSSNQLESHILSDAVITGFSCRVAV